MTNLELDRRQTEDLIRQLEEKAGAYVPQWRFDRDNPDLGTALSLIYSELFAQTLKRYNQVPEKNRVAFFSSIGMACLPALPAEGFVTLGLSGPVDTGEEVPAGTPLLADVANEEETTVTFETQDDILVTSAQLESVFTVCGKQDYIGKCYPKDDESTDFHVFSSEYPNLQTHVMELHHSVVLQVSGGGDVVVELVPNQRKELPYEIRKALNDPTILVWEYVVLDGWRPFARQRQEGNRAILSLDSQGPALEIGVEGTCKIRLRLMPDREIPRCSLKTVELRTQNQNLIPDHVYAAGADGDVHEFFPFGEQLGLFAEGYFGCNEALIKAGAEVSMDFHLDFVPIPVEYDQAKNPINWKMVMKKKDFRLDEAFDIAVQEVIWEYFNGKGWGRLLPDNRYAGLFSAGKGALSQRCTLRFTCPADIQPALVGAGLGYYIRARALKVSNLYKFKGNYIAPLVSGTRFSYGYAEGGAVPETGLVENNCHTQMVESGFFRDGQTAITPFALIEEPRPALYFQFSAPPTGGPVKLLFQLAESLKQQPQRLLWQYKTSRSWETLSVVDETESFRQTGVLSIMVGETMAKATLWGVAGYWIRAIDEEGRYFHQGTQLPHILQIYGNTTRVRNVVTRPREHFFIHPETQNFVCNLQFGDVVDAQVWVDEWNTMTSAQMAMWKGIGVPAYDRNGICNGFWIPWQQREDFDCSTAQDRHYILDKNKGILQFSDGIHGRIPAGGKRETIRVDYTTGGGTRGNLPVGAICRGQRAMGYVSQISNPRPTVGGCDQETLGEALNRGGAMLRHGDRAVTASDFQQLALEASRAIVRTKCFANRDGLGKKSAGQVTLVVLLRDYEAGGDLFPSVRATVQRHIASRCGGNLTAMGRLHVVAPRFLELSAKVELQVATFNHVFGVRQEVRQRLDKFLNPLTGNFDGQGWPIGQIPNETQLRNCLSGVANMVYLEHISITAMAEGMELTLDDLKDTHYGLPTSGDHHIFVHIQP